MSNVLQRINDVISTMSPLTFCYEKVTSFLWNETTSNVLQRINDIINTLSPFTFYYEKNTSFFSNLTSLGPVFALFKATIDKSHFGSWVNLEALQQQFPHRVQVIDTSVILEGPVLILSPKINSFMYKYFLSLIAGAVAVQLTAFTIGYFLPQEKDKTTNPENKPKGPQRNDKTKDLENKPKRIPVSFTPLLATVGGLAWLYTLKKLSDWGSSEQKIFFVEPITLDLFRNWIGTKKCYFLVPIQFRKRSIKSHFGIDD